MIIDIPPANPIEHLYIVVIMKWLFLI
uniref:Uncharacterized protein n=1 Tax=Solanum lycopersicum TaxID=4081 RepID=A0A3Q7IFD0_SOLLC